MRAPDFWQRAEPGMTARLLAPAGALYGAFTARRMAQPGWRCGAPVICIGNFTAGGAGKTPLALAVARMLIGLGERPFFLSRGYGGSHSGPPLRVDPAVHSARETGDEPLLLARAAPVFIGQDRIAGAKAALSAGASVIVMDDGMQNPSLHKDLVLAAIDGGAGIGNGLCIPAGPLRAPLAAQLARVDAMVLMGAGQPGEAAAARAAGKPVFHAALVPEAEAARALLGARVVAFAGIGRPEKFFETLREIGADIAARRAFPDHHRFTLDDLEGLTRLAHARNAVLVTTEKDATRLPKGFAATALPVEASIAEASQLTVLLKSALARAFIPRAKGHD